MAGTGYDPYLLIGAEAGLFVYNKKTSRLTPVRLDKAGSKTIPNAIDSVIDGDGDLWISTWGKDFSAFQRAAYRSRRGW
ncbi:hypothetical protein [Spirosoma telluris]|uniref:hypothetical protein n=1 Tax=Spirosoma telluris TaxID=2183553 RepID=UPI002FC2C1EA